MANKNIAAAIHRPEGISPPGLQAGSNRNLIQHASGGGAWSTEVGKRIHQGIGNRIPECITQRRFYTMYECIGGPEIIQNISSGGATLVSNG